MFFPRFSQKLFKTNYLNQVLIELITVVKFISIRPSLFRVRVGPGIILARDPYLLIVIY